MVSWQEWHYCGCDDPTTSGPGDTQALVKDPAQRPRGSNVFHDKLKALARAYPRRSRAPRSDSRFDPGNRHFELVYTRRRVSGHGRFDQGVTVVFLPDVQYPNGYRVQLRGGSLLSPPGGQRLFIRARGAASRVELSVTPRR